MEIRNRFICLAKNFRDSIDVLRETPSCQRRIGWDHPEEPTMSHKAYRCLKMLMSLMPKDFEKMEKLIEKYQNDLKKQLKPKTK